MEQNATDLEQKLEALLDHYRNDDSEFVIATLKFITFDKQLKDVDYWPYAARENALVDACYMGC